MKLISSRMTSCQKLFVRIWMGGLSVATSLVIGELIYSQKSFRDFCVVAAVLLPFWLIGIFFLYLPSRRMADAVWDNETSLVVQRGKLSLEITFMQIANVPRRLNSKLVILELIDDSVLGEEIRFLPKTGSRDFFAFDNSIRRDLERRVDWLKREGTHPMSRVM